VQGFHPSRLILPHSPRKRATPDVFGLSEDGAPRKFGGSVRVWLLRTRIAEVSPTIADRSWRQSAPGSQKFSNFVSRAHSIQRSRRLEKPVSTFFGETGHTWGLELSHSWIKPSGVRGVWRDTVPRVRWARSPQ